MPINPQARLGRYEILSQLGAGGMGVVYLAHDTMLDRKVALKILPAELEANRARMQRFTQEAKAAAALNHPNIAHVYEIGETDRVHYIAMEYIEGATLREKIHHEHAELKKLLRYLQHVAEGLVKAHAAGIVHRDLKPDNVMITRDGFAKILDFGLAKLIEGRGEAETGRHGDEGDTLIAGSPRPPVTPPLTSPGLIMGTAGYMSPEQAQGKPVDHRSDIFSFGCLLYEAATGQRAFQSESKIDTLHKIIHASVPLVKDANPAAPADLTRIVRRCLAKDADDRYQSIKEVAIELRELRRELQGAEELETTVPPSSGTSTSISESSGVRTPSTSSAEYVIERIKLHKLATVVLLALLVLAGVGLTIYLRARNNEVDIDSIAVLPFTNKSSDPDTDYLSEGLAESLIYRLSQLPNLKVSPTSSVFRYKGKEIDPVKVGNELGSSAVISGRITQRGDNLTISVELVDVRNNKLIWGEHYERKISDLLATQREIAREITENLKLRVSGQVGLAKHDTESYEAYQFYLKGRFYWSKRTGESLKKAIEHFEQALAKDPNYQLAYTGLADCYVVLAQYGGIPSRETLPKAKAATLRALQIDNSLAEAHTSLGFINFLLWQFEEAEKEFKLGIELKPNYPTAHHWYSVYLRATGQIEKAMAEIKLAQQLDPLSSIIGTTAASLYLLTGDLNTAIEECNKVIEIDPNFASAHYYLGWAYLKQKQEREGIVELQRAVEVSGRGSLELGYLGYGYGTLGRRDEAMAVLRELEEKHARQESPRVYLAAVYAGLGEKDRAFAQLEKEFQAGNGVLIYIAYHPNFDTLRDDPRYADLLRRIGLRQ